MRYATPALEIVHHTVPERINEDTWLAAFAGSFGEQIVFAAIDGATTRLTPPPLQTYLDTLPIRLTPAAFAARTVRASLAHHIATEEDVDPRALMLTANADLGDAVRAILGDLTLDAMLFDAEIYETLQHDPRLVRLGLPVCVMTLAVYDPVDHSLRYAHAGDTALLVAYTDDSASVPTASSEITIPDSSVMQLMANLRANHPNQTAHDLTQHPDVRRLNLHNALRHNFVDEHGLPQPSQGIGVLNGQSELRYFVKTGEIDLREATFACVMTDGLEWPASAAEAYTTDLDTAHTLRAERIAHMAGQIAARGLAGYLELLRTTEAADADHNQFPRMKTHDDAAGVRLCFADAPQT